MKIRNGVLTLLLFVLAAYGATYGQTTRTYSLANGDQLMPSSSIVDSSGVPTYFGGAINGSVTNVSAPAVFTLSIAFRESGVVDAAAGIYSGIILAPNSTFAITESARRKSVSTSGSVDGGTVTYRLIDGRAEIISVVSSLTVYEGKNKSRRAVGTGTLDYGTSAEGSGTMVLNFF